MTKDCLGYQILRRVYCRPCGDVVLDQSLSYDVVELHASAKDWKCCQCKRSLSESAEEEG